MKAYKVICLSLLVLLPSSSFSIFQFIDKRIKSGEATTSEISLAAKASLTSALQYQVDNTEVGSKGWLIALQKLALQDSDASYRLSQFYRSIDQERYHYWLSIAKNNSHDLALLELAQYHYQNDRYKQVISLINDNRIRTDQLKYLKVKSLLALGEVESIPAVLLSFSDTKLRNDLIMTLSRYHILPMNSLVKLFDTDLLAFKQPLTMSLNNSRCRKTITFVGTNFEDLKSLDKIKNKLSTHPIGEHLCATDVVYQPIKTLGCSGKKDKPIMCDEANWRNYQGKITSEYIGVLLPKGGANTHYGLVYFDRQDSFKVITHELSHLLGFVDEYQLSNSHNACQFPMGSKGLNMSLLPFAYPKAKGDIYGSRKQKALRKRVISQLAWGESIDKNTPLMMSIGDKWVLGTPKLHHQKLGLFPSETCQSDGVKSFKPLGRLTSLRNTDIETPQEYFSILEHSAEDFAMPSYHYNVALSLFRAGDEKSAKEWLDRALAVSPFNRRFEHLRINTTIKN